MHAICKINISYVEIVEMICILSKFACECVNGDLLYIVFLELTR